KPSKQFLDNLEASFGFKAPRDHGFDTIEAIKAMHRGQGKVFFALGGNFLSATPDTNYTAEALRKCELTVQVSTKLNRSHLVHGQEAIILPTLGRSDIDILNGTKQFVSVENSMGVVHSSEGNLSPVSDDLISEPAIICRLALESLTSSKVNWARYLKHYDHIREDIERTIPGFENYNQRVRIPEGFYLPNGARDGVFHTETKKANFAISNYEPILLEDQEFLMMTIRSHDQFNTTIYGLDDRYRGIYNERRVILMNAEDMKDRGLQSKDVVDIYNNTNKIERVARHFLVVPYDIPRKCVATYFPETNVLVPISEKADKSGTPISKSVIVEIMKLETS
ncbi:MAG: molybdopterin dinucleotide binding domain-containing protein, partial [Chitinophagales bacterium]